jgi:hypothetical protein
MSTLSIKGRQAQSIGPGSSLVYHGAKFSTAVGFSNLASLLKDHKVFERVEIPPGKMFNVLNVVQSPSDMMGSTLQQTIVQELAASNMAELVDMYSIVACVGDSSLIKAVKKDGSYDRMDDASDYHSLPEYLLGYKTHSFQLVVASAGPEEEMLQELVRIAQPGGFVALSSKGESVEPLLDDKKTRLIEAKDDTALYQV